MPLGLDVDSIVIVYRSYFVVMRVGARFNVVKIEIVCLSGA